MNKQDQWFQQIAKQQGFHTQAEMEQLLKDSERLNWLEANRGQIGYTSGASPINAVCHTPKDIKGCEALTILDAIDARMALSPTQGIGGRNQGVGS